MAEQADEFRELLRAARTVNMETELLVECVQRRLIPLDRGWNREALEAARRVQRLMALGVNLQGLEVVFHMRRQILQLQEEMDRMHDELDRVRQAHEREIARLLREMIPDR